MTTFYTVDAFASSSFKNATIIIPAVSLGNVPQLTADLLITSLGLRRVGYVGNGDTVAPFVGADEDGLVTGGLEVYGQTGSELYIIQQRSPTLKSKKDEHVALLNDFIVQNEFGFVLLLASLDSASQDDAQLLTPHQRILPPDHQSSSIEIAKRLSHLPPLQLNIEQGTSYSSSSQSKTYPPFLPAAGLTRRLLASLASAGKSVPHGAVTAWTVEGDNRGDAHALASTTLKIIGIENDVQLQEPKSWEGLFGSVEGWSGGAGADSELYG